MSKTPYSFSPIDVNKSVTDTPMWRDGSSQEENYSGELLLSFTALTPLLVGNLQRNINQRQSTLVPQMLENGQILIPGSSLNGMLRSTLSNLLQSPMSQDKVTEHHYTYRPNLGASGSKREMRAAVVLNPKNEQGEVEVLLLPDSSQVAFIQNGTYNELIRDKLNNNRINDTINDLEQDRNNRFRTKLQYNRGNQLDLNHQVFLYKGGIDGEGILAQAFNNRGQTYNQVLYPYNAYEQTLNNPDNRIALSAKLVKHYYKTQEVLANTKAGHITNSHPLVNDENNHRIGRAISNAAQLEPNQLIYVEVIKGTKQVTSFGHHYHYRWAYTSSIHEKDGEVRQELRLLDIEKTNEKQPQQLAASRLLFGYTQQDEALGQGDHKRLAGRLSFNFAIESEETLNKRLQSEPKEIQLQTLGLPRPSAVEFYLKQNKLPKELRTYGDEITDPGSDLSGRKFYQHQPDARNNANLYTANQYTNTQDDQQGTFIKWYSQPGSKFNVTLSFANLRPWELGALLLAINPRLAEDYWNPSKNKMGYAHKLGYAKPLGFGSIRFKVDKARWHKNDSWDWQIATEDSQLEEIESSCLSALKDKLTASNITDADIQAWLSPLAWSDKGSAAYPEERGTIFGYHSKIRIDHAKNRRSNNQNFTALKQQLDINKAD